MKYIADIHIHSYYSRATSKNLNLEHLNKWAQIKGLSVIATGDISHPKWLEEMREKLVPAADGLFKLKPEYIDTTQNEVPGACESNVHFILSGEISNIYKRGGQVRKVHNVVLFPSLQSVASFQNTLDKIGNIRSDGRPILGLDSRDLLEIVLETDERGVLIPAHIWTPWFSMLGSKSGFDRLTDCYGDLSHHIFALETGLSSDPPMNWRVSMLDGYNLVSNSDAHSPAKLAREANILNTDLSYDAMMAAFKDKETDAFWGTLEFFPEEGKYHMDGHRKCNSMTIPKETMQNNGLCPVCGKPATLGVSYRVEELADRPEGEKPANAKPFISLVPLPEVISEIKGVGPNSKTVQTQYWSLLRELGPELNILMDMPLSDLETAGGPLLAEAIRRIRESKVLPQPGYDGEFGVIRVFQENEKEDILKQGTLFAIEADKATKPANPEKPVAYSVPQANRAIAEPGPETEYGLNAEQQNAVTHRGTPLVIIAGPGTGKTRTLTHRIASLITESQAEPVSILAVTFTRKAAREMQERLAALLDKKTADAMHILTFHALGADLLRRIDSFFNRTNRFTIIDTGNDTNFQKQFKEKHGKLTRALQNNISSLKSQGYTAATMPDSLSDEIKSGFMAYEELLVSLNAVDYDDLVLLPLQLLRKQPELRRELISQYKYIAVDEFQDINRTQYELFSLLAVTADDVCVIGDPDQAIYGFRGASNAYFAQMANDFDNVVTLHLGRNYRCAQNILNASIQILEQPEKPKQGRIWSNLAPDVKVILHSSTTERAEAEFVVHRIEQLIGGTSFFSLDSSRVDDRGLPQDYSFSDMAILLRSRQLFPAFQEALSRSGIPYDTLDDAYAGNEELYSLFMNSLRLANGQTLNSSNRNILARFFWDQAPEIPQDMLSVPDAPPAWTNYINLLRNIDKQLSILETIERIVDALAPQLSEPQKDDLARIAGTLPVTTTGNTNRLTSLVDAMMLQTRIDLFDDKTERVRLMTMHASKGLEFPVVFIPGCEEDIIPHRIPGQKSDLDEERRLLYVAMTRAKQQLYLIHAHKRLIYGENRVQMPSRFLASISASLLTKERSEYKSKPGTKQMKLF